MTPMSDRGRRRLAWAIFALAAVVAAVAVAAIAPALGSRAKVDEQFLAEYGITYRLVVRQSPRIERIHLVTVDLEDPDIELVTVPSDKPADPATGRLTQPRILAARASALLFINANPWISLSGDTHGTWTDNQPVRIMGLVATGGDVRSMPAAHNCAFYLDRAGRAHVGNPDNVANVDEGIAGFLRLLSGGNVVVFSKPDEAPQPRTAVGIDATGRYLTLLVVDGRQKDFSMGMTHTEMAEFMKSLGCTDAVNLDGGGSSILMLAGAKAPRKIVNSPSDQAPRPIPVGLAVRIRPN